MGRRLRIRLDLLIPSVGKHVEARQYSSMVDRTAKRGLCHFHAGDAVLARNYGRGEKWIPGVVTEVVGSRHYMVELFGNLWKRHLDQNTVQLQRWLPWHLRAKSTRKNALTFSRINLPLYKQRLRQDFPITFRCTHSQE